VTAWCWGDSGGLLEVAPVRGEDRGVLVSLLPLTPAGWRVVPGALECLMSTKETVLLPPPQPGSMNPEQRRVSCAAHKDFNLPRIFPSRGAVFRPLVYAKLLDLLLTGNAHCTCPSFPSP